MVEEDLNYKDFATSLKDQANELFQNGDTEGAIKLFSQAIDVDPDNHIFYSNRSAAYMKVDSVSKALRDAEKCVELAPEWAKGYNRLGVAQQCLKRYDAALATLRKGIELDPNSKALWEALKVCQDAMEVDKKHRFSAAAQERQLEEERIKRQDEIKNNAKQEKIRQDAAAKEAALMDSFFDEIASSNPEPIQGDVVDNNAADTNANQATEDNELADFFNEISGPGAGDDGATGTALVPAGDHSATTTTRDESSITEKYANQELENGRVQYARLLASHYQWRNLNPYSVFLLGTDATEEDIRYRYKKLSLKVHPDRLRDVEDPNAAFEQVKIAYEKLMDADQRKTIIYHIERITEEAAKDRRKALSKGVDESTLAPLEDETSKRVMKHFAEMENMRRRSEKNLRAYSARDKMQETEAHEELVRLHERDKKWSDDTRRDKRMGNWREFLDDPTAKKVKASSYKEEKREEKKHGVVELETWKRSWK